MTYFDGRCLPCLLLARAGAAASGEGGVPPLTATCRAAFPAWHVTPGEIGAILSAAGWKHRQWRERRGNPAIRVRGYAMPEEVDGKINGWGQP